MSSLLLVIGLASLPVTASAAVGGTTAASVPSEAPDVTTATSLAWRYGRPIEVLSERTESSQTFAQPDGTMRTQQYASPQRVRRGSGWVSVNPTLRISGGLVTPVAATLDMRFAANGSQPLVTVIQDGRSLSLGWPVATLAGKAVPASATLPPSLDGNTVTYPEVFRGIDLKVTATADSFGEVLVVKSATALAGGPLSQLKFGLTSSGLTLSQAADGMITAVGQTGDPLFFSDGAAMWDSPTSPDTASASASAARPSRSSLSTSAAIAATPAADEAQIDPVVIPVHLSSDGLTVTPSQALLTDPGTNFPVSIDPGFNGGKEIWTEISKADPGKSFWTDTAMRDAMRVGRRWHAGKDDVWRTLARFDVSKLKSSYIVSASVLVTVGHSADCSKSPIDLYLTSAISPSKAVTWNNTNAKGKTWTALREVSASANKSQCPKGDDQVEFGDPRGSKYLVRRAFQAAATGKASTITFAFRAPNEGDDYQWKKLVKDSTYLDVVYDNYPGKATAVGIAPCDHNPCKSPAKTYNNKPQLIASATDVDKDKLRYEFYVYDDKKVLKASSTKDVTGRTSGGLASWTVVVDPKKPLVGLPDGNYQWQARACDVYVCGAYSDFFAFTVDTTNPDAPDVSSDIYQKSDPNDPDGVPGGKGGPSVTGQFKFTPKNKNDVSYYVWTLTGDSKSHTAYPDPNATDGSATVPITPIKEGPNRLTVGTVDAAGNQSASFAVWPFKVAPAGGQWVWDFDDDPAGSTTAMSTPVNNRPATAAGTGVTRSAHGEGQALDLSGTGEMSTSQTVLDTADDSGFTVAAWVYLPGPTPADDPGDPGTGGSTGSGTDDGALPGGDDPAPPVPATLPDATMTVLSQDGVHTSMFQLEYRTDVDVTGDQKPDPAWCFSVAAQDVAGAAQTRACSGGYVHLDTWTHLVGLVDSKNGKISLYINGGPNLQNSDDPNLVGAMVQVDGKAGWVATGNFVMGRGQADGPVQRWTGEMDDVRAVPRVWTETEIMQAERAGEDA